MRRQLPVKLHKTRPLHDDRPGSTKRSRCPTGSSRTGGDRLTYPGTHQCTALRVISHGLSLFAQPLQKNMGCLATSPSCGQFQWDLYPLRGHRERHLQDRHHSLRWTPQTLRQDRYMTHTRPLMALGVDRMRSIANLPRHGQARLQALYETSRYPADQQRLHWTRTIFPPFRLARLPHQRLTLRKKCKRGHLQAMRLFLLRSIALASRESFQIRLYL